MTLNLKTTNGLALMWKYLLFEIIQIRSFTKMPWQGEHPARETGYSGGILNLEQLLNFDLEGEHAVKDSEQ